MARSSNFNPKGVLVARKSRGLDLGGKHYAQGEAIEDDCISLRKQRQLYAQNHLCHPYELSENSIPKTEEQQEAERVAAEEKAEETAVGANSSDSENDSEEKVEENSAPRRRKRTSGKKSAKSE